MKGKNRTKKQVTYVDGIKVYKVAGTWYADWNLYNRVMEEQGRNADIEIFCSWCNRRGLEPTG